jgi:capsid protein
MIRSGRLFGRGLAVQTSAPSLPKGGIRGRFDTQYTTEENRRHWAMADGMSVDASASWLVRRTLRIRSRYEFHNNSYLMGICRTVANYVVGTGPRLQMLTPDKALNAQIEDLWNEWAREIRLADTLWLMRLARLYNGESFALLRTNPRLECPVKLDVFQVEADQVSSPLFGLYPAQYPDQYFDGLVLDPYGRPLEYHVLRQHPGAYGAFVILGYQFDTWPAQYVLHDYKRIRPGQQRGIPELVPALSLIAKLRRYTDAVVAAAETAADIALAVETQGPADPTEDSGGTAMNAFDTVEFRPRMGTVLPDGYRISQIKAEQPTTTFDMFTNMLLREICRCLDLPAIFASLDARDANMSSAYVVTQPFARCIEVDRAGYNLLLDRILDEFLTEAIRVPGALPGELPDEFPHHWMWPSIGNHADPDKVASAQQIRLSSGTTSIPREFAKDGLDWEAEQEQDAKSMGLDLIEYRRLLVQKRFGSLGGTPPGANAAGDPNQKPGTPGTEPASADEETDADDVDDV